MSNEARIKELIYDVQEYIDNICQGYIEEIACEQYDNEGVSMSLDDQDSIYHEIYDSIKKAI